MSVAKLIKVLPRYLNFEDSAVLITVIKNYCIEHNIDYTTFLKENKEKDSVIFYPDNISPKLAEHLLVNLF